MISSRSYFFNLLCTFYSVFTRDIISGRFRSYLLLRYRDAPHAAFTVHRVQSLRRIQLSMVDGPQHGRLLSMRLLLAIVAAPRRVCNARCDKKRSTCIRKLTSLIHRTEYRHAERQTGLILEPVPCYVIAMEPIKRRLYIRLDTSNEPRVDRGYGYYINFHLINANESSACKHSYSDEWKCCQRLSTTRWRCATGWS